MKYAGVTFFSLNFLFWLVNISCSQNRFQATYDGTKWLCKRFLFFSINVIFNVRRLNIDMEILRYEHRYDLAYVDNIKAFGWIITWSYMTKHIIYFSIIRINEINFLNVIEVDYIFQYIILTYDLFLSKIHFKISKLG